MNMWHNSEHSHATYSHPNTRKCPCKGTGLIPPNPQPKGTNQAYCPQHKPAMIPWPQAQADGSTKYIMIPR